MTLTPASIRAAAMLPQALPQPQRRALPTTPPAPPPSQRRTRRHGAHEREREHGGSTVHGARTDHLVLVQDGKVVCVVEHDRQESALSVARLLCRLLRSEAFVYACPRAEAEQLHPDLQLAAVPDTWRGLYRATPWNDPEEPDSSDTPVVGIR